MDKKEELTEEEIKFIENLSKELDTNEIIDKDKYVLRELISGQNKADIVFKTDLELNQIQAITQLRIADDIFKIQSMALNDFDKALEKQKNISYNLTSMVMELLVSKRRLGRTELIEAYKGGQQDEAKKGFLSRVFSR